jgi:hypothetical protein
MGCSNRINHWGLGARDKLHLRCSRHNNWIRLQKGIATIFTGSADEVSRMSTLLHVIINVLSTLLLSASNYAMQVLSAPTRNECVKAHQQRQWLDIGILSMRNIGSLTLLRKVLWFALGRSSIPLHLLYIIPSHFLHRANSDKLQCKRIPSGDRQQL